MKYSYYPGCSLESTAGSYHQSTMAVAKKLGIEFAEVEDWNCCGATEFQSVDLLSSYALISRNLALAELQSENGHSKMVAPCSACYLNLKKTDHNLRKSPQLAEKVQLALDAGGLNYTPGSVEIHHLLDLLIQEIGLEAIAELVTKPLFGLRIAPYYGCVLVRPEIDEPFDDTHYPTSLDKLMQEIGTEVVDFPMKTHCCGGHMTQIKEETALEMIRQLLQNASDSGADIIATVCPMCQLNLDAYQKSVNELFGTSFDIPILYFTQLIGLAFGFSPKELGIGSDFVNANLALNKILPEAPKAPKKIPISKDALLMPSLEEK